MPSAALPNIGLAEGRSVGEDGWGPEMNANLRRIDCLTQLRVLDKDLATPPGSPANGATYIVAGSPTGAWAGHATHIARYWTTGTAWEFYTPLSGWTAWVIDESLQYRFNGSAWA